MIEVENSIGKIVLLDAREGGSIVEDLTRRGIDLDDGMVLIAGDQTYVGPDALHAIALISTRSGIFNRLNYFCFRSKRISRTIYPMLRFGRSVLLKILNKKKINQRG